MSLKIDLETLDVGQVATDTHTLHHVSADASIFRIRPKAVVYPRSSADIQSLVRYVGHSARGTRHPTLSLTVRSAGTDMTGGPLSSSIVVDVAKHLTGITHIGSNSFTALPGTPFRDIEAALAARGLMFPAYPASKACATIGGMVANNAGGELTLRYGKTEQYVRSLKAVLADGNEYTFGQLSAGQVTQKLAQHNFEGDVYRSLVPMLKREWTTIAQAKPAVSKNSTGYLLWNAYKPTTGEVDLAQLLVGSQGTLGIITEVELAAVPREPYRQLLVIYLDNLNQLGPTVDLLRSFSPSCIELFDDKTLKLALRFAPKLAQMMGQERSLFAIARDLLPDAGIMLRRGLPAIVLLAEFSGANEGTVTNQTAQAEQKLVHAGSTVRRLVDEAQADVYWMIRRQSFHLLRKEVRGKQTVPFIDDVVVPVSQLTPFLQDVYAILSQYPELEFSISGHAGDGNLHIFPLMDMQNAALRSRIPEIADRVYDLTLRYGGSLSAEHNDGLIRGPYLTRMYSPKIMELFGQVKTTFDPIGIFNPHKKLDATFAYATKHMKHDNEHSV